MQSVFMNWQAILEGLLNCYSLSKFQVFAQPLTALQLILKHFIDVGGSSYLILQNGIKLH